MHARVHNVTVHNQRLLCFVRSLNQEKAVRTFEQLQPQQRCCKKEGNIRRTNNGAVIARGAIAPSLSDGAEGESTASGQVPASN
jgi:hypothetical protein